MQAIAMFRKAKNQSGITLIELVVTIVVLGVVLVTLSGVLQGGASNSSDITIQIRATALAQAYLDEILGKRYDEKTRNRGIPPCRASAPFARQCTAEASFGFNYGAPVETGENARSRLDDVDDYHGMDEGDDQTLPLQDAQGNTRAGYDNFRVRVAVRYINLGVGEEEETLGVNNELDDQFDAKLITVTVSFRGNTAGWDFSAYKSNF
ncbi:MAG: prepilin-type N-terminal cleavage/methylation domain-containing protein [Flavobacteriales bacterium]|nr:prepilin-type N-terminal cleavage/methylation domain-containing protein [Flavobacteriales bacterium]